MIIISFPSTGKCSKGYLQVDLSTSPFRSDRGTVWELVLKNCTVSVLESLFNRVAGLNP